MMAGEVLKTDVTVVACEMEDVVSSASVMDGVVGWPPSVSVMEVIVGWPPSVSVMDVVDCWLSKASPEISRACSRG